MLIYTAYRWGGGEGEGGEGGGAWSNFHTAFHMQIPYTLNNLSIMAATQGMPQLNKRPLVIIQKFICGTTKTGFFKRAMS
jgi:hypothetical protein